MAATFFRPSSLMMRAFPCRFLFAYLNDSETYGGSFVIDISISVRQDNKEFDNGKFFPSTL